MYCSLSSHPQLQKAPSKSVWRDISPARPASHLAGPNNEPTHEHGLSSQPLSLCPKLSGRQPRLLPRNTGPSPWGWPVNKFSPLLIFYWTGRPSTPFAKSPEVDLESIHANSPELCTQRVWKAAGSVRVSCSGCHPSPSQELACGTHWVSCSQCGLGALDSRAPGYPLTSCSPSPHHPKSRPAQSTLPPSFPVTRSD